MPEAARKHFAAHVKQVVPALEQRFALAPASEFDKRDVALAEKVAAALGGVTHSSDTECPYFACVMAGADLENDAEFFGALGVKKKDRTKVGGHDTPVLETTYGPQHTRDGEETTFEENTATLALMTQIDEDELADDPDEYLTPADQKKYAAAAKVLEDLETVVVGGVLCADPVSKLVFTVAKTKSNAWAGVLTSRIET